MVKEGVPVFANQMFLDFFSVKDTQEFNTKFSNIDSIFLKHDGFLYKDSCDDWFTEVSANPQKLYNIKLQDKQKNLKHFILKYQNIPKKENYGIISFDDVTELNLLQLYDANQVKSDENLKNSDAMYKLLEVIQRNSAKIELHNFYKGISITHDAVIMEVKKDNIILKTDYMQEKAIQFDKRSFITSDALPNVIACDNVSKISFKHQSVEFTNIHFALTSPVSRKALRVVPDEKHTVTLFIGENKFHSELLLEDISLEALKLNLDAMPAGLNVGDEVTLNMALTINKKNIIINSKATMFRKTDNRRSFSIVFMLELKVGEKHNLTEYMTLRQMEIIREFKGMQNG